MHIFYSESKGRPNVEVESPTEEMLESTLDIFRNLDQRKGFLGVLLDEPFILQLLPQKQGVKVELLDSSIPAIDFCETDNRSAEILIEAAANGKDVFHLARQSLSGWEHLKLG